MKTRRQIQVIRKPTDDETNCKKLIRQYRDHCKAADRIFLELTNYVMDHGVNRGKLIQWFIDENYAVSTANQKTSQIFKTARRAGPELRRAIAAGEVSFKEANRITTAPTKTVTEKQDTIWFGQLKNSARVAVMNGVSKELFIQNANIAFDYYANSGTN